MQLMYSPSLLLSSESLSSADEIPGPLACATALAAAFKASAAFLASAICLQPATGTSDKAPSSTPNSSLFMVPPSSKRRSAYQLLAGSAQALSAEFLAADFTP